MRRYERRNARREFSFLRETDEIFEYIPWRCTDYSELDTNGNLDSGSADGDFGDFDKDAWTWSPPERDTSDSDSSEIEVTE